MKKLFSLALFFALTFVLFGCEEDESDVYVHVFLETDDEIIEEKIPWQAEDFDIITELENVFDLNYQLYDDAVFLNSIGPLDPYEGSFILIEKNGEAIEVGLNELTFSEDDELSFSISWWNQTLKDIYDGLVDSQAFVLNHEAYFEAPAEMYVSLGLAHLENLSSDTIEMMDASELEEASALAKEIFVIKALNEDPSDLQAHLAATAELIHPYSDAINVLALQGYEDMTFVDAFIGMADDLVLEETDHDTLSLVYFALSAYNQDDLAASIADYLYNHPHENLWGSNASSYAWLLMVYTHMGADLSSEELNDGDRSFIETFLAYQTNDGSFIYLSDDEDADLAFSTPQAFLSLAFAHAFVNGESTHPFDPYDE